MSVTESIIAIKTLLAELSNRIKDRESAGFVQQIQTHQRAIESAYLDAEHKALDYHRDAVRLESENLELKKGAEKQRLESDRQIAELELKLKQSNAQAFNDWMMAKAADRKKLDASKQLKG